MSTIDHPAHYNAHPAGIECIDVVEHLNFNVGNAIKYLWRAGHKTDDPTDDLRKAAWYVQREIDRIGRLVPPPPGDAPLTAWTDTQVYTEVNRHAGQVLRRFGLRWWWPW